MIDAPSRRGYKPGMAAEKKKKLTEYLPARDRPEPRTVRAPAPLWERVDELARRHGASVNEVMVAMMAKACDEEGV